MPRSLAMALGAGWLLGSAALIAGPAWAQDADRDLIERGKYLATAGDCVACHTAANGKPMAGNHPLKTPIGTLMTPNLTPDKETGLGGWTYEQFDNAFRRGIGHEGEYLYPAFPFAWYTKVSDEDSKAIWAYLQSLEPVNEKRKESDIPFPFNIRTALITWRTAFFSDARFKPDPGASAEVNRGGYLVEGLGHCGMCHNENKLVGNTSLAGRFGGGVIDGWYAPNITPDDHSGIGGWSDEEVAKYLKTGTAPGKNVGVAAGPMRQTIEESLSKLEDSDIDAMVAYLRTVTAKSSYKAKDLQVFNQPGAPGADTYLTYCSSCHKPDGQGIEGAVPALAGNSSVQAEGPESILRVIYGGLPAQSGYAPMPAIGQEMTEQQVRDVTDYIRNSWGNKAPVMNSGSAVSQARDETKTMLSGTAECTKAYLDGLEQPFEKVGLSEKLKGLAPGDFASTLSRIVPEVKREASGAGDEAIVNGLTTAFCQVGKDDPQYAKQGWTVVLGSFANVAYSQVRNPEKQADAGNAQTTPPAGAEPAKN